MDRLLIQMNVAEYTSQVTNGHISSLQEMFAGLQNLAVDYGKKKRATL